MMDFGSQWILYVISIIWKSCGARIKLRGSYGNDKFLEYLEYIKFSKLIEYVKIPEKESNIKRIFDEFLWKEVLSKHPKFKDVFEDGKKSFIKESTTIKKIVIALSSIDFNNYDYLKFKMLNL